MAARDWLASRSLSLWTTLTLSILLGVLGVGLVRSLPNSWSVEIEERVSDAVWRWFATTTDERRVIIVDIDERSLAAIGPWPWPRATQARLIEQIALAGARKQILDVVFTDARPEDAVLQAALQRHTPVLAQAFALEQGGQPSVGQPTGALDWPSCPAPFGEAAGHVANAASLLSTGTPASAGPEAGHITPRISMDGLVRFQPAVICYQKASYPALGVAAVMRGFGEDSLILSRGSGWGDSPWRLSGKNQDLPPIPLNQRGDIRIPWSLHPDSFVSLPASDVLNGRVPADVLRNAWVLVGSSAFGLNDTIATPFGGVSAGLQVHAQLISALIDGRIPYTPSAAGGIQLLLALAGVALIALVARNRARLPVYVLPLSTLGALFALMALHALLQVRAHLWLGWFEPALFLLIVGGAIGILEHMRSRLDRDRLYSHLSSYLPAPVAAALALQSPSNAIKASTRTVSVMIADIRNFSAYCEARPPEEAAAVLHAFFSTTTRVVEAHGGVVESFSGDAVFSVWNASHSADQNASRLAETASQHPGLALKAANELLLAMSGVLPDPAPDGLEPLALGIGVETGPAMSGSFGLASRRTHMVMGRTVTIAGCLVDMTADLAHPILVGEGLAAQVGGEGLESIGVFLLDGLRVPHHIYAPPIAPVPHEAETS